MLSKKVRHNRIYTALFPSYKVQNQAKPAYGDGKQTSIPWEWGGLEARRGHERAFSISWEIVAWMETM